MTFNPSVQGMLIYLAMLAYVLAAFLNVTGLRKSSRFAFLAGFGVLVVDILFYRQVTGHIPLQSLFEIFLCLGAVIYPISLFCRHALKTGGDTADPLMGFAILWPAGFVFRDAPMLLPPALQSPLFIPHVAVYLLAYVILAKAAVEAVGLLLPVRSNSLTTDAMDKLVRLGFPFLTAGLMLGAWWGKIAWGDFWHWDPKELWALATWLVFFSYFHARQLNADRNPRAGAGLVLLGALLMVITLVWVNLLPIFSGLHNYAR